MSKPEEYSPPWLVEKVEKRINLIVSQGAVVYAKKSGAPFIMTFLDEGDPEMTDEERERWERTCDNCGRYIPEDGEFYTGHMARIVDDVQIMIAFGVCGICRSTPPRKEQKMTEVQRVQHEDFDLADLLARAQDRLKAEGWVQGEFRVRRERVRPRASDRSGGECEPSSTTVIGYCAMGAGLYELGIDEQECSSDYRTRAVADALAKAVGIKSHHASECTNEGVCTCVINWVTTWNDDDAPD